MINTIKKILFRLRCIASRIKQKIYYLANYKKNNPNINLDKVNRVLFVDHPDDEILFFSKQLLNKKDLLVICMTNGDNKVRSQEFRKLMKEIDIEYQIWNRCNIG